LERGVARFKIENGKLKIENEGRLKRDLNLGKTRTPHAPAAQDIIIIPFFAPQAHFNPICLLTGPQAPPQ